MKTKYLYIICIGIMMTIISSCDRIEDVDSPVFDVKANKEIYQVGDSVRFTFSGNPDIISFYSGELGNDYSHVDGRVAAPDYFIKFETQSQNGAQTDQMRILISKNFDGDYTIDGVHAASWEDITDRFRMAPASNGTAYIGSGLGSFKDLLEADADTTKLYFAVKQNVFNQNTHGIGNLNRLRYFTISSVYETLNSTLYEHAGFGWKLFSTPNKQPDRASLENSYTIMMRNSWWTSPEDYYSRDTEDWAVSSQIPIPRVLDMGPDRAIAIKGVNDISIDGYTYLFRSPGVYKVVFRATNANVNGRKDVIRELTITVTN